MKIKPNHLEYLRSMLVPLDTAERRAKYVGIHTSKRYRWDVLWAASLTRWVCENIYPYANDVNLDYALRRIIPDLEERN
jgi:hypothetical protein